jgi:hypothetical protein
MSFASLYDDLYRFCKNATPPIVTNKDVFKKNLGYIRTDFQDQHNYLAPIFFTKIISPHFDLVSLSLYASNYLEEQQVLHFFQTNELYAFFLQKVIYFSFCHHQKIIPVFFLFQQKVVYLDGKVKTNYDWYIDNGGCMVTVLSQSHSISLDLELDFDLDLVTGSNIIETCKKMHTIPYCLKVPSNRYLVSLPLFQDHLFYFEQTQFDDRRNAYLVAWRWQAGAFFHVLKLIAMYF